MMIFCGHEYLMTLHYIRFVRYNIIIDKSHLLACHFYTCISRLGQKTPL